jgi:hypothetical protein
MKESESQSEVLCNDSTAMEVRILLFGFHNVLLLPVPPQKQSSFNSLIAMYERKPTPIFFSANYRNTTPFSASI